jgi:hypothetical protein
MSAVAVGGVTYVDSATSVVREARRQSQDVQATHLCEAGAQVVLHSLWVPFKVTQRFTDLDSAVAGACADEPRVAREGELPGVGKYTAGIIAVSEPDSFTRVLTVRSVGWQDNNDNDELDENEPRKVIDIRATYQLARSQVFDYAYFVNNYGWMDGFDPNELIVNGDMRANGNFEFRNGFPTVNGSIFASMNEKLTPASAGLLNTPPVKWATSTYRTNANANPTNVADNQRRWRQGYDPAVHGARGTAQYEQWRDLIFDSEAQIVNNRVAGAVAADAAGTRSWQRTTGSATLSTQVLDPNPTEEVIMPDLSDLTFYQNLSNTWRNNKATFADGTANPNFNQGAFVEVWDATLNGGAGAYRRLDTNGVITGSAVLVGTSTRPIRIHGPVTVTQDAVIKGHVTGQGTLYTGRNVHVVGSVRYVNRPNFRGTNPTTLDQANEKADMLALAARGSVMMGNIRPTDPVIPYMRPPFTRPRISDTGAVIPAFDCTQIDQGQPRYRTVVPGLPDSFYESINQVDAVLYTNFVGGGNVGTGGGGVIFNGSLISRDEAMVVYSLPMRMNYDTRIRERSLTAQPLIDVNLPRSPVMLRSAWQDRGFSNGY